MKQLKNLLLTFFFFFIIPTITFATSTVSLETNKKNFDINDPIQLKATIVADGNENITVKWIANLSWFQIIWRSQSQSYQNINGQHSAQIQLNYTLKAKKKWEYALWPLVLSQGTGKILSNTVKIKVTWEQIFLGNANTLQQQNTSSNNKPTIAPINNTPQPEHFDNIKDIKKNMSIPLLHYGISLFILILAWWVIYLYFYRNKKKKEKKEVQKTKEIIPPKKKINYQKMIKNIEKNYMEIEKEKFYAKLGNIFRLYISQEINTNFETKTLQEARDSLDDKYYNILQKLYYPEYNTQIDDQEERKLLIKELLLLCK